VKYLIIFHAVLSFSPSWSQCSNCIGQKIGSKEEVIILSKNLVQKFSSECPVEPSASNFKYNIRGWENIQPPIGNWMYKIDIRIE